MKKDLDKKPSKGLPPTPEVPVSVILGIQNYDTRFVSAPPPYLNFRALCPIKNFAINCKMPYTAYGFLKVN